jgi:hypothetical protein
LSWAWAGTSHGRPKHDLAQPPLALHEAIPAIGEHETVILLHNDAVVEGLSEAPFMRDVTRWGVLTIGTEFGNACFTNRAAAGED